MNLLIKGKSIVFSNTGQRPSAKGKAKAEEDLPKEEGSIEIVATIVGGYIEGISHTMWKAQIQEALQVISAKGRTPISIPTMTFSGLEGLASSLCMTTP